MTKLYRTNPRKVEGVKLTPLSAWEHEVFDAATSFSVIKELGRVPRHREDFKTFPEAHAAARGHRDKYTRGALIYAITDAGRSFCIEREKWDLYLDRWMAKDGA